ncbi:peptidase T [Sulfitobacter pacificus]|uniref:Peptidase T n=1 Tax=Sulfitobacter pacificus TaxID=1499314 RepID=A0ABQ5VJI6_9RHOB|nr:peptidase T [Sulfitobacter pacificus]GLQ27245.1 peptidase T [Sulfitobacter pacificus]
MTRSEFDSELEARLLRYAAIDSQSDATSPSQPSTEIQLDMSRLLVAELSEMGAQDVQLTEYGVVLATIPATAEGPVMGWCAHVDTAPQFNANGVKPVVHRGYNGGDITFADAPDLKLSPENSPYLGEKQGEDIITASGLTLLGGDDKAGVAIAMTAARHLLQNPEIKHGKIRLAFTPDEEIGRGVDPRLPEDFGVDFAYTFDGGKPGEIEFETFSADGAVVRVTGVSAHPGFAKDKMVNALHLASKIVMTLPHVTMTPDTTDGKDGFIHVSEINGGSTEAEIVLIIRDFELDGLAAKGDLLRQVCGAVAAGEPRAQITCEITPQYRNMRYWLEKDMTPVELIRAAVADVGLDPVSVPIRGGTDGSRLTEMGVPCPNVFTGMQEIHGPLEWISVQDMALASKVAIALAQRAVS